MQSQLERPAFQVIPHPVLCRMACDLAHFSGVNRSPMRHKTGGFSQRFEIAQQLIIRTVSSWLALRRVHFGEDGLL